ncbi:MAG TPA: GNAT family N-acetyltransferase [Kofleriaceae bacterium]|nr:GNAT family N-acetyltransferase [Kofleriaceae bacterium]
MTAIDLAAIDLAAIEAHLRRAPYLHAYELGDLDPAEASHTTWYASDAVDAVALLYRGLATPTLVALGDGELAPQRALLTRLVDELPARFYAHLTPGLAAVLAPRFACDLLGHNVKMALVRRSAPADAEPLTPADADAALAFYAAAYPTGFFAPESLARGVFVAVRDARGLAAVAGTHVYSPAMRVAALGSIATRPDARGRGLAQRVTAALCHRLQDAIDVIGLNVRADNAAAIACYQKVGFAPRHEYDEWLVTAR